MENIPLAVLLRRSVAGSTSISLRDPLRCFLGLPQQFCIGDPSAKLYDIRIRKLVEN